MLVGISEAGARIVLLGAPRSPRIYKSGHACGGHSQP